MTADDFQTKGLDEVAKRAIIAAVYKKMNPNPSANELKTAVLKVLVELSKDDFFHTSKQTTWSELFMYIQNNSVPFPTTAVLDAS